jgi:hypothetical protein
MNHQIGAGLGPDGSGLLATVEDIWTVPRKGGDERKMRLLEGIGADIRRLRSATQGRDAARLAEMESRMAALRPTASGRSRASFDIMQRAIDDIRKQLTVCDDYLKEADEAEKRVNRYVTKLDARIKSSQPAP